ncbi:helix-turn-helix domain-containing protein [Candidatus Berkelbacteria bacterium]|nr:helix-turn-helix domain-containing protein [Candidatus Berkelbacteria bacterium]
MSKKKETYLTVEEIATLLRVHQLTVLRYIKRGELRALKLWKGYRIAQTDFDKFIESKQTSGGSK